MMRRGAFVLGAFVLVALAAAQAGAQEISNLESGRPVVMEDATPIATGRFSASADYAYARRLDNVDYAGPAFSLVAGVAHGFEFGAESRLLTNPRLNARRGIGSGDLDVHGLGQIVRESEKSPAIAVRGDVFLGTGFASHGTNASAEALLTTSFDAFRLNGGVGSLYVGSPRQDQRRNQLFAVVGIDTPAFGKWKTDTLAMADVIVRQSVLTGGKLSVGVELGLRHRIGLQTLFYAGMSSEVAGEPDRLRYRGLLGLTHAF
jgi:hypothetical protein